LEKRRVNNVYLVAVYSLKHYLIDSICTVLFFFYLIHDMLSTCTNDYDSSNLETVITNILCLTSSLLYHVIVYLLK